MPSPGIPGPGPTFDRVYLALKEQLTSGRFEPGEHLEPASIGDELNASITPVRDALHRLVGERIVTAPRHDGFRVPAPSEAELRDLYGWNGLLLELAVRRERGHGGGAASSGKEADRSDIAGPAATADLFLRIARLSRSAEHQAAIDLLSDRLGSARAAEELLFADAESERRNIGQALEERDLAALRRRLSAYHRRRQRCVPDLIVLMRDRGRGGKQ